MTSQPDTDTALRNKILSHPDLILNDQDVMRALVAANERAMGGNVVDLRGIAMDRLEERLGRLEDTHRSVIAAAYDNLAGTNQVHRAILRMLEQTDLEGFLNGLNDGVAEVLRVDIMRLVLESRQPRTSGAGRAPNKVLSVSEPGSVNGYMAASGRSTVNRPVVLRQVQTADRAIYGDAAEWIRSEACLKLDFGPGCLPGMLVMGSADSEQFLPSMGTDLLEFFAGVFERTMRHWLS